LASGPPAVDWEIVPLTRSHDRASFDCGEESLNRFLRERARKHAEQGVSKTFVAVPQGQHRIAGYLTLAFRHVERDDLPDGAGRRLPPEYHVPVVFLGRLAVDRRDQGTGLGKRLLMDALSRCSAATDLIGGYGLVVDAINDEAERFYLKYGFTRFDSKPGFPRRMLLSIATVRRTLGQGQ
jgi:GNAT superfamily N-acetyltransferase